MSRKQIEKLQAYAPLLPYAAVGGVVALGAAGIYLMYLKLKGDVGQGLQEGIFGAAVPTFLTEALTTTATEPTKLYTLKDFQNILAELERAYEISKAQMNTTAFDKAVAAIPSYNLAPLDQALVEMKIQNWYAKLEEDRVAKEQSIAENYSEYSLLLDQERTKHEQEMRDLQNQLQLLQVQNANQQQLAAIQNQIALAGFQTTGLLLDLPGFTYTTPTLPTEPTELGPTTTETVPLPAPAPPAPERNAPSAWWRQSFEMLAGEWKSWRQAVGEEQVFAFMRTYEWSAEEDPSTNSERLIAYYWFTYQEDLRGDAAAARAYESGSEVVGGPY